MVRGSSLDRLTTMRTSAKALLEKHLEAVKCQIMTIWPAESVVWCCRLRSIGSSATRQPSGRGSLYFPRRGFAEIRSSARPRGITCTNLSFSGQSLRRRGGPEFPSG